MRLDHMNYVCTMKSMRYFHEKLSEHIEAYNERFNPKPRWTLNRIGRVADIPSGHFSLWKKPKEEGGRSPSDGEISKMCAITELGFDEDLLWAWKMVDEYGIERLQRVAQIAAKIREESSGNQTSD